MNWQRTDGPVLLAALILALPGPAHPQQLERPQILSFSVGADQTLTYPNNPANPGYLTDLPDEHTTFMPPATSNSPYLVFGASRVSGSTGGAVALETTDLRTFSFAASLGYQPQVFTPPVAFGQCNPTYDTEFDENYAAPGSVLQDPSLPAGNLIMLYEAENHCPGGVNQQPFYATVGFARSSDSGKTWPSPANGISGNPARHPVLQSSDPQPTTAHPPMGNAIPSAFIDDSRARSRGDYYVYVTYSYYSTTSSAGSAIRIARAQLGADSLSFMKWYNGAFSQPGVGGVDTPALPSGSCSGGSETDSEITWNDDLGLYVMIYTCVTGPAGSKAGAWYYSTATNLDLEDWTTPQMIANSQFVATNPCPGLTAGTQFDGWYPSSISPGAATGHTKLTGYIFFLNGCNIGQRSFMSRTFTIATQPQSAMPSSVRWERRK